MIPEKYLGLIETESEKYAERTRLNVINSDATLLLTNGALVGGSKLTADIAIKYQKPLLHLDLSKASLNELSVAINDWIGERRPSVLNIAGPRASEDTEIYDLAYEFLSRALKKAGPNGPT